jgi:hypothetical protein
MWLKRMAFLKTPEFSMRTTAFKLVFWKGLKRIQKSIRGEANGDSDSGHGGGSTEGGGL